MITGLVCQNSLALRRCDALVCPTCHVHCPLRQKLTCPVPRFEPCRPCWFWLSRYGATRYVACESPADLSLVEAWVLALETGEGEGFKIPGEILSLLHINDPTQ